MRPLVFALLLAACSEPSEPPRAFTADDQRQLNEAAEMLNANSVSSDAILNQGSLR
jgi:uncharacterized lipoprotein